MLRLQLAPPLPESFVHVNKTSATFGGKILYLPICWYTCSNELAAGSRLSGAIPNATGVAANIVRFHTTASIQHGHGQRAHCTASTRQRSHLCPQVDLCISATLESKGAPDALGLRAAWQAQEGRLHAQRGGHGQCGLRAAERAAQHKQLAHGHVHRQRAQHAAQLRQRLMGIQRAGLRVSGCLNLYGFISTQTSCVSVSRLASAPACAFQGSRIMGCLGFRILSARRPAASAPHAHPARRPARAV